ncbi:MAG: TonB-dependent receptor, partial [Rhodothermales bacterium]
DEVLWGALVNANYRPHPMHEFGFNYIRNKSGESAARYQSGPFPRDLSSDAVYQTRTLQYVARTLDSYQARGEHLFFGNRGLRLEWTGTLSTTSQDEPDLRFFTNNYTLLERGGAIDTIYAIRPSIYPVPTRYFRTMEEDAGSASVSAELPFRQWAGRPSVFKVGGSLERKDRTFRERRFEFRQDKLRYTGDEHAFFDEEHVGILEHESTERFFRFGNYVTDATQPSSNYDGDVDVVAFYGMVDLPISRRLRAVGGLRVETTDMHAYSVDESLDEGEIETVDVLPSMNLVYELQNDMNVRLAYGRTLARPTLREIAPYASFNFVGDYIFIGNTDLDRTLIDNYDLRWEWFVRPGEIVAVSGFYKHFRNPIERAFNPTAAASNPNIEFQNVDNAQVYGVEIEARKRLTGIAAFLDPFQIGANASLVRSEVDIQDGELELIQALRPDAPSTRSLQGQSPYTINLNLSYDHTGRGTTASVYYNVFGPRLDRVAVGGTPNIFEQPRHVVDLTFRQRLLFDFSLKASVKNLLDERTVFAHTFKGRQFVAEEFGYGRSFSLGLSYDL